MEYTKTIVIHVSLLYKKMKTGRKTFFVIYLKTDIERTVNEHYFLWFLVRR